MATNSKFIADLGIKTDADLQIGGNTTIDGNATVSGNLTVNGTSLTVNATTTSVEDNMLELANANTSSDTLDIGIYGNYDDGLSDGGATEYTGLFRDASDSTWKLFDGLEVAPTTTVNTSGTGYTLADLTVGDLTATTLTATNGLTGSSITYPTSDGTNGQVIKTNGSGTLSFGDIPAGYADSDVETYLDSGTSTPTFSSVTVSGAVNFDDTTGSTSTTTGALIVDGGVGIAENLYVGGTIDMDRLSLTSSQTTVPPLRLTANSLNDGVGALRIDGSQADIYLNPSTATHTTVTFAVNDDQRLAFGMDNSSDFYITRRTSSTWYDDTFVLDRDTGLLSLGYGATIAGSTQINALNINGAYTLPTADGTANQVLSTDGSGTLTFGDIPAGYADSDARSAISAGTGISYNSSTGVITNTVSNTDTTYSAGTGLSLSGTTFSSTITQYADSDVESYLSSNGTVGIGNTSVSSYDSNARNLVVGSGTGDEGMTIASGSGSGGRIYFADGTSSDAEKADGYIFYNHASQYMAFGTAGGSEKMRIETDGQVQVTNTGGVRLDAIKGSRFGYSSAYKVAVIGGTGATTSDNLALGYDPSTNASGSFTGYGEAIYVRNDVEFRTPNTANNGYHNVMTFEDGNVKMSTQPSFFCYPSASFTATGGSLKYTFASEAHDSNNEYNHSTGKFTAPTAGRYMFLCNLAVDASTSELTYAGIGVRKNNTGSVYFGGWADKQSTSAAHYAQASSSIIMYLAQGDYVELYIELSGSHTILGGNNGAYTRFCGQLLS